MIVMAGNGRRFLARGRTQADMEDGLLDVLENAPAGELVGGALADQLLGDPSSSITGLKSPSLRVSVLESRPMNFSLDGEMLSSNELSLDVREDALRIPAGDACAPHPGSRIATEPLPARRHRAGSSISTSSPTESVSPRDLSGIREMSISV